MSHLFGSSIPPITCFMFFLIFSTCSTSFLCNPKLLLCNFLLLIFFFTITTYYIDYHFLNNNKTVFYLLKNWYRQMNTKSPSFMQLEDRITHLLEPRFCYLHFEFFLEVFHTYIKALNQCLSQEDHEFLESGKSVLENLHLIVSFDTLI